MSDDKDFGERIDKFEEALRADPCFTVISFGDFLKLVADANERTANADPSEAEKIRADCIAELLVKEEPCS